MASQPPPHQLPCVDVKPPAGLDPADDVTRIVSSIGSKVAALRKRTGWSLQQLATRADVSAAAIHKIEQSDMVPTITTLLKIAVALGKPVSYFAEEDAGQAGYAVMTPAATERDIYTSHHGIQLRNIAGPYGRFFLAGARATVQPGADSGTRSMEHPGEELVHMLRGVLHFTINDQPYRVGPGDTLHFRGDQPHSWANRGTATAFAIWMALRPQ